ncbi:uncharacterized protein [Gossypium hirsutum]|uniref:Uncharacterized protein isoform X2 n=1 Tax=Gossypium hirsutum TaxID=3635 RepID=A0ABM3ATT9_GOSHI|nr:uncharacterized protein LOC107927913 isoform X2 [Gossypium hirsutum]
MMMNTNMKIKIEEEEEELFDDEGNDRLPISQLFQLLQQRQSISMVYIVRMNGLDEIDAALGLLRLQNSANQTGIYDAGKNNSRPFCNDINQYEVQKYGRSFLRAQENQSENGTLDVGPLKWKALGLLRLLALQMPLELPRFPPRDLVLCRGTTL